MSRSLWVLIAILLLLIATGSWLRRDTSQSASTGQAPIAAHPIGAAQHDTAATRDRGDASADASAADARRATVARASAGVISPPDINAPARDQIRFWRAQAATGDPYAQCRFAAISQLCAGIEIVYAPWAKSHYETQYNAAYDANAQPDCRGVDKHQVAGAADALLAAAARGHVPSQVQFAAGRGFTASVPDLRDVSALRKFRTEAPALAWRAFDAGDSDAAVLLWRVYNAVDADYLYLSGAIDPDPVMAHALDLLMDDLLPDFVVGSAAEAGLDAGATEQARALHAKWRAGAFAHARAPRFSMQIEEDFEWKRRAIDMCAP